MAEAVSASRVVNGRLHGAAFLDDARLQRVLACLNGDGEETRVAGGAVRNALLGEAVRDVDLATTALPEITTARARAAHLRVAPTGIEHGTVTVICEGVPFEVTTLREDVETDGRRAVVRFGRSFEHDALRRDFTINALFVDAQRRVYDFTGGLADLEARRVRFIGEPRQRIAEDYLRILRLFRFHAAYGAGAVDRDGLLAAIAGRQGLAGLSRERIGAELLKMVEAPRAACAVEEMAGAGLLGPLLGGVPFAARLRRLGRTEAAQDLRPDATLRLAALAVAVEEDAERLQDLLRLSNLQTVRMAQAVKAARALTRSDSLPGRTDLVRFLYLHGRRAALDGLLLVQPGAQMPADAADWRAAYAFLRDTPEPRLPFTGTDLMQRGVPGGPALGAALKRLQALWVRAGFPRDPKVLAGLLEAALAGADAKDSL